MTTAEWLSFAASGTPKDHRIVADDAYRASVRIVREVRRDRVVEILAAGKPLPRRLKDAVEGVR